MSRRIVTALALVSAIVFAGPSMASDDRNSSQGRSTMKLPQKLAGILASGDGKSRETAFKVDSIREEYEVLGHLGLRMEAQSLVTADKPYDVMRAVNLSTGEIVEVWFDISSFFGRGF